MVGGKRRRSARKVLGSHQKCWLFGRHAVLETLRAGTWKPLEVWLAHDLESELADEVRELSESRGIEIVPSESSAMTRRCGTLAHQGLMAKMPPYPYVPANELLSSLSAAAFYVLLDGIQDPFNFGAILRSVDVFGADGVFVPSTNQSDVTVQVARSSSGAVNHVRIAQVDDLLDVVRGLRSRGVRVVAASEQGAQSVSDFDFLQSCAIVIGSEGAGVRSELAELCDAIVQIPQSGHIGSLNAAVAAGILLYEVRRQRGTGRALP
jgi:23S rRNA (guanosine2251-2'-O)-methyltransferase